MSSFEEEFPSITEYLGDNRVICVTLNEVREHCLDKQRVREAIIKHTQGTKFIRHPDCDRPYGDECGYCEFCRQTQSELQSKIFKELGLDEEE